jgi:selenoprotein W-related protein
LEHSVSTIEIIPSGGGVFEVDVDGERVFSKKELGRHAGPEEVLAAIRSRV